LGADFEKPNTSDQDHIFRSYPGNGTNQPTQQRPYEDIPPVADTVLSEAFAGPRGMNADQPFILGDQSPSGFYMHDNAGGSAVQVLEGSPYSSIGLYDSSSFPTSSPIIPSNTHIFQSQLNREGTHVLLGSSNSTITTEATLARCEPTPGCRGFQRAQANMNDQMNGPPTQHITPLLVLKLPEQEIASVNIQLHSNTAQNTPRLSSYEKRKEKKRLAQEKRKQDDKVEMEQQARDDHTVEEIRRRLQEVHPRWRDELGWQIDEPEYYDTTLRQYLQRIYPAASGDFIDELVTQGSYLLMRIQSTVLRTDTRPDLSLRQLLTLALIARPDRTANQEELVRWLERRYPWYVHGVFRDTEGSTHRSTLRKHVGAFLDQMAGSHDRDFEPINPSTHTHEEGTYVGDNPGLVWHLLPGQENSILINPVPPARLLALPPELHLKVLDEYLAYPGTLYATQEGNEVHYYTECSNSPEWLAYYSATTRFDGIARDVYLLRRGPLTDPFTFAESVWGIELATDAFFRNNTIAIGNRAINGYQIREANAFQNGPLSKIGERGRRNLSKVDFDLIINGGGVGQRHSDIDQAFRLLGQSQYLKELTLRLELYGGALLAARQHRFRHIPGFQILPRFRGISQFTLIVTSTHPLQAAPLGPESWIEVAEERLRSRITQPILRLDGSRQALRDRPKEPSTLMSYGKDKLYEIARPYGFDPNTSRLSNGKKLTVKALALWVSERQHMDCKDPGFRSEKQWEKKASGIYLIQIETQGIVSAGKQKLIGGPVSTSSEIMGSVSSLFGGPPSNPVDKGATPTTLVLDPNSTGTDKDGDSETEQVSKIASPNEGDQNERSSYAKRKEPPTDEKGNGGKKPKTK
jgi:hypothetical protein